MKLYRGPTEADLARWKQVEQVVDTYPRLEAIDAEQIRKAKKAHGGGKPQSQVREEGWRAAERSKGFQSSGQRKRIAWAAAQEKRRKAKEGK